MATRWARYPKLTFAKPPNVPAGTPTAGKAGRPAPLTIRQQVNQWAATQPKPFTTGQITTQAQGMLDPIVQRLTQQINQRAAAQSQALGGYTDRLAQNLAGAEQQLSAPYRQSAEQSAAVAQSLANRLQSGGEQTSQDLAVRLAQINAPTATGEVTGQVAQDARGAGNALYAGGTIDVNELLKNASSAGSYGAKLPGIARLEGLQQQANVRQQAASDLASGVTDIQAQLPTIIQNLRNMSEQRGQNIASGRTSLMQYLTNRSDTLAANKLSRKDTLAARAEAKRTAAEEKKIKGLQTLLAGAINDRDATGALTPQAQKIVRMVYKQLTGMGFVPTGTGVATAPKAPTTRTVNGVTQQWDPTTQTWIAPPGGAPPEPPTPKEPRAPTTTVFNGAKWQWDPSRKAWVRLGKAGSTKKSTKRPDGLTANQSQKYRGIAQTIAQDFRNGYTYTDKETKLPVQVPPKTAQEAIAEMRRQGVPEDIIRDAITALWPTASRLGTLPR